MNPEVKVSKHRERRTELWEIFVTYIGIILTLLSLLLFAVAGLEKSAHPALASSMNEIAKATLPIGVIALIFERILRKYYISTLHNAVREEIESRVPQLTREAVMAALEASQSSKIADLKVLEDMRRFGLARVMTRQEMEVCDVNFRHGVEALIQQSHEKTFLIVGKTLSFISQQRETLRYGLQNGVTFRLCLIDPVVLNRDTETQRKTLAKVEDSIRSLRKLILGNRAGWNGCIELRRMSRGIENAFSSFTQGQERISVLDLDLGDDVALQSSQVYIHDLANAFNFGAHLYSWYLDLWNESEIIISFPNRHKYVYVYARQGSNLVWVRKQGRSTWELPGGKVKDGELADEAAVREFREETGLELSIDTVFQTAEKEKLAFVGKVGDNPLSAGAPEIAEVRAYPLRHQWTDAELTYPETGYAQYIRMFDYMGLTE